MFCEDDVTGFGFGFGFNTPVIGGGSSPPVFPAFAYEAEAQAVFDRSAALGDTLTSARKFSMNRLIRRLKGAGLWDDFVLFYLTKNSASSTSKINLASPGTHDLVSNGSVAFTANDGWAATGSNTTDYLDTGYAMNLINRNDHTLGVYIKTNGASAGNHAGHFGAVDGSGNGFAISTHDGGAGFALGWSSSGETNIGASGSETDYNGFAAVSRTSGTTFNGMYNGSFRTVATTASVAVSGSTTLTVCKVNGKNATTRMVQAAFLANRGFTEAELRELYGAILEYNNAVTYGEFIYEFVGEGTQNINADIVFYGSTFRSVIGAYEAARAGLDAVIIGGWRDRRIGGMPAGGLGYSDYRDETALGGLPRWVITKINALSNHADDKFYFEPRYMSYALRFLLDPAKNGGYTIPVYYTDGVNTVSKTGTTITSITTVDGRTVIAIEFVDGSDEVDLAYRTPGVTLTKGREAAGSGAESINGFRGIITTDLGGAGQFVSHSGSYLNVDPYNTPGNSGSGLLPGISRTYGVDTPSVGSEDDQIQAYCFRMLMTNTTKFMIPFPSTPPSGYDEADFEILGRWLALDSTLTFFDLVLKSGNGRNVSTSESGYSSTTYDYNSNNGFSLDYRGGSKLYPAATYAERETIWKEHWNRQLGFMYYLQHSSDSRIPSAVRTEALKWGWHALHYPDHHENDNAFDTPQLYVRETWRLVGDFVLNANDLSATDGTTPRSIKTAAISSYEMDSHSTEALADPNGGTPRIWNSGNFQQYTGGVNLRAPIPIEVMFPKQSECTNLQVLFGISSTHAAFGSVRMEFTMAMLAQTAARNAKYAIDNDCDIQDVDYSSVRTALLASPSLPGEVAPILDQVN